MASLVLREWVDKLGSAFVCLFREKPAGFMALRECGDALFVHLAAVEEKFRMSGAAMALYAKACKEAGARGFRRLEGRISSCNTAVMNIYAAFGAVFTEPYDVFLKEVGHDA